MCGLSKFGFVSGCSKLKEVAVEDRILVDASFVVLKGLVEGGEKFDAKSGLCAQ